MNATATTIRAAAPKAEPTMVPVFEVEEPAPAADPEVCWAEPAVEVNVTVTTFGENDVSVEDL
jgi:hypothetical protein